MSKPAAEEFIVLRDRESMFTPAYWNPILQTSQAVKENYGKALSVEYNFFSHGRMNTIVPKQEWDDIGEYIASKLINEKELFENIEEKTTNARKQIESFLREIRKKDFSKSSSEELVNFSQQIYSLFMKYDAASVFAWFVAGDALKQKIGAYLRIQDEELDIIALPEEQTVASKMDRDIMEAALEDASEKIGSTLAERYFWIPFGYDGPNTWDYKHFSQRIEEYRRDMRGTKQKYDEVIQREKELKQKSQKILADKKIGRDEYQLVYILRITAVWTDERKKLDFQLFFWYSNILKELCKRYGLSVIQLKYLFTNELSQLEGDASRLREVAERRISEEFMTISTGGNIRIANKAETTRMKEAIRRQSHTGDIRGNVACRGIQTKYMARVKVLQSSRECSKVERGEILVATMTTPDYVPAMNRALGFITDEGGVTCHAAIVAREMNKPCIIGTKIATQVLKDGDMVEVNTEKGVVKILNR